MIEISHLVVDGCSLTFCQGLEKPHVDGWPALLAKRIGVPVVNLALGGASNDGIHRRTYDYVYKSIDFYKKTNIQANPFYIIALTFAGRREEYFKNYYNWNDKDRYYTLDLNPDMDKLFDIIDNKKTDRESVAAYVEYGYLLNFDLSAAHLKKLHYWASLVNLFKQNNINYGMGDYIPTYEEDVVAKMITRYKPLHDFIYNDTNNYGDFAKVTRSSDKLKCGHDGPESQKILADYLYNKIIETHGEIVVKPLTSIYKLKQFYFTEPSFTQAIFSEWYLNS
jgi:hypothetical protein